MSELKAIGATRTSYEEFTRLAETRLAQNNLRFINIAYLALKQAKLSPCSWIGRLGVSRQGGRDGEKR